MQVLQGSRMAINYWVRGGCGEQARGLQLVAERERARTAAAEAELHRMQALQPTFQASLDPQVCSTRHARLRWLSGYLVTMRVCPQHFST